MSGLSELRDTFFLECSDLLEALEDGLRRIDAGETDSECVNSVFRAVHSIKGGAGAFKLSTLVNFAHGFENVLDLVRSGALGHSDELTRLLHRSADRLADLVELARGGDESEPAGNAELLAELVAISATAVTDDAPDQQIADFVPVTLDFDLDLAPAGDIEQTFVIKLAVTSELYAAGHDPAILFRNLAELGDLKVEVDAAAIPDLAELNWQDAYGDWTARLTGPASEAEIREIFDFLDGLCDLEIQPETRLEADGTDAIADDASSGASAAAADRSPDKNAAADGQPPASPAARPSGKPKPAANSPVRQTVRVDLERVDRLINAVGELVINQAVLSQAIEVSPVSGGVEVESALDGFRHLLRDIQEGVMAIRAQPIKTVFQRMFRIVREASEAAGKSAELVTLGEMTEVDKIVIEQLTDPLTHMIRNAVDHGLEASQDRAKTDKSEVGQITLSASHRSGRVIIEVADDGGGIDRDRVLEIAISKDLVPPDAELSPSEIDKLLFLPGFSTAAEVSALSGRGVGMDVVQSAIQALGGRVSINSRRGEGTKFTISLPLTLAVLDGMVVEVADQAMVLPITAIVETLRPSPDDLHQIGTGDSVLSVRGTMTPVIDLGHRMGLCGRRTDLNECVFVLVESDQERRYAIIVDRILDQRQVVIKSLESNYRHVEGIAAATILGNGRIALIVDPELARPPTPAVPTLAATG